MVGTVGGWVCGGRSSGCTWLNFVVEGGCCCRWLKLCVFVVVVDADGQICVPEVGVSSGDKGNVRHFKLQETLNSFFPSSGCVGQNEALLMECSINNPEPQTSAS